MRDVILSWADVSKAYGALRPLRVRSLTVRAGERIAILGIDAAAAETFVNLLTGASLPDTGRIELMGRLTSDVPDADQWLAGLERVGVVSVRAILLDDLTVLQNVAMAFTMAIDALPDEIRSRASHLASEAGLTPDTLDRRVADLPAGVKARCHLARALAMDPSLLVLEHANAFAPDAAGALGETVRTAARARNLALVVLTADETFARAAADRVIAINRATGEWTDRSGWRSLFS